MEQRKVRFEHVKGHSNDRWNDEADELANTGATGKQCNKGRYEGTQGEQTHDTPQNTTHQVKSNTTITTNTNKHKEDIRRLNDNRLINIRIQERDRIHIPKPTYGQGANRRARFAFGKITTEQAKQNTALHARELQKNLPTEKEQEEEREQETEEEQGRESDTSKIHIRKKLIIDDIILQEKIIIEEEEEDIFFGNDEPSVQDIA